MRPVIRPVTKDAVQLFAEGALALGECSYNGILCDRDYCSRQMKLIDRQINSMKREFVNDTDLGRAWSMHYKGAMSLSAKDQLRVVLYEDLREPVTKWTAGGKRGDSGKASVDNEALEATGREDVKLYLDIDGLEKMKNTYLKNLLEESEADGFIHPFFHLSSFDNDHEGGARSFRSSSSAPNFQNQPARKEEEKRLIRQGFRARPAHRMIGRDYDAVEVKVSACNHQDPNMVRYIEQGDDMHRDMASLCYILPADLCEKKAGRYGGEVRQAGKNQFVFPQFYFQEPRNSAQGLWQYMFDLPLRHPADPDKLLHQHLANKGIRNFDAFADHIEGVCHEFWEVQFPGYGRWRQKWIEEYHKKGYIEYLTGFRVEGVLTKYQLGNYPIQGPAFHCLLKSLIEVWKLWKGRRTQGFRSLLIGQIHDELVTDEHDEEYEKNQIEVERIMTTDLRNAWPWLIVPMTIETKATPVGGTWYDKK